MLFLVKLCVVAFWGITDEVRPFELMEGRSEGCCLTGNDVRMKSDALFSALLYFLIEKKVS